MKNITFKRLLEVLDPEEKIFVVEMNGNFNAKTTVGRFGEGARNKYGDKEVRTITVLEDGRLGIIVK